jgi:tRNA(fMet)-specific endonuclease VapC
MRAPETLLDSDVLSAVLRSHARAASRARAYLQDRHQFTFSVITRYEIVRGLKVKNATSRLQQFDRLCAASRILPLTDAIVEQATTVYADLHQRGQLVGDADILIAATALEHGLVVATNNEAHFSRIPGLTIDNWLK